MLASEIFILADNLVYHRAAVNRDTIVTGQLQVLKPARYFAAV